MSFFISTKLSLGDHGHRYDNIVWRFIENEPKITQELFGVCISGPGCYVVSAL